MGPFVYLCVICWRHVCWCTGAADDVDLAGAISGLVDPVTSDTGVCDTCWCDLGGQALRVREVKEVQFEGPEEVEFFEPQETRE